MAVDQSRHDEAQAHLCAVPSIFRRSTGPRAPFSTARVHVRDRGLMNQSKSDVRSLFRGGAIGATAAVVAFGGVYAALAATQAGVEETQTREPATVQSGMEAAQQPLQTFRRVTPTVESITQRRSVPARQPGIAESVREAKRDDKPDGRRERALNIASLEASAPTPAQVPPEAAPAPAPVRQAPVPGTAYRAPAPAPVQQAPAPVWEAPAPVQQAPVPVRPAPAPVQQAPAPEPFRLVPQLPVVPQEPIPLNPIRIG